MYPPLKNTELYVEVIRRPGENFYKCNQSYKSLYDAAVNGTPIRGVIVDQNAAFPGRVGGFSGVIQGICVSTLTKRIVIAYVLMNANASNGSSTSYNSALYMMPNNDITDHPQN